MDDDHDPSRSTNSGRGVLALRHPARAGTVGASMTANPDDSLWIPDVAGLVPQDWKYRHASLLDHSDIPWAYQTSLTRVLWERQ